MHELSLAVDLMRQIEAIARNNRVTAVHRVVLHVGVQKLVVPEAMQEAFRAVTEGTVADSAELQVIEKEAIATCNACKTTFKPRIDDYRCPTCAEADVTFVQGNDIVLASMECDVTPSREI